MLLVDTHVRVDVLQDDPQWAERSIGQLRAQSQIHALAIDPVVDAELSLSFSTLEALDAQVARLARAARDSAAGAVPGGQAFARDRRLGGSKVQLRPDFFIGAHAAVRRWPLLTRDATRFRTYFPGLQVLAP